MERLVSETKTKSSVWCRLGVVASTLDLISVVDRHWASYYWMGDCLLTRPSVPLCR